VDRRATPWNGWVAFGVTLLAVLLSAATLGELLLEVELGDGATASELDVILLFGQPLLVSLVVWTLLNRHCKTGSHAAGKIAEIVASLYAIYAFIGLVAGFAPAAVGVLIAPFLLAAVLLTPRGIASSA
jgi:hypothetical protein